MQPTVYMLCGVPGSGKTTWAWQNDDVASLVIISTDGIIEFIAENFGKGMFGLTYDECFHDLIKFAEKQMYRDLEECVKHEQSFIWDQTNLTPKKRAGKLSKIPAHYRKVAVNFQTPAENELKRRLAQREGKTIPENVLTSMITSYVPATLEEGFDEIINVENN